MNPLQNPNFRLILVANAISNLGDGFHTIAAMWWVKVQTGSDGMVAAVALAKGITSVCLAPFAGAFVDRYDRRKVMLFSDFTRALVVLILGILAVTNQLKPWELIVASVCLSAFGVLFNPAFSSSIPNIVRSENLASANANLQISSTTAQIAGPALGGLVVSQIGSGGAFLVDAISFLLSAACVLLAKIPTPEAVIKPKNSSLLSDMREGWLWIRGQRLMFSILCLAVGLNFIIAPLQVLIPGYAKDVLHSDAQGFGLLQSGIPIGFLVGALLLNVIKPKMVGGLVIGCAVTLGLLILGLGLSSWLLVSVVLMIGMGIMLAIMNISFSVVFQSLIPNEMQGRIGGLSQAVSSGFVPLGMAIAPLLISWLGGISPVLVAVGLLSSLGGLFFLTIPGFLGIRSNRSNLEAV